MEPFSKTEIRNCRRFIKYCYTLAAPVDTDLLERLSVFGFIEITKFSSYSNTFKDIFKINFEDQVQMDGTIEDLQIYCTVSKNFPLLNNQLEDVLVEWFNCNGRRKTG